MSVSQDNPEWVKQMLSQYTQNARIAEVMRFFAALMDLLWIFKKKKKNVH
jgi:hypothetical protein